MYKDEKLDGPFEEYDRDGKLIVQGKYKNGTLLL
jgi:antitoxin component YwqK of YwqJK toxin-antitoxin module